MKKTKRLRKRPMPLVPRTEEQKQHDLEAISGVSAFAGAFVGALGGALAASAGERKPSIPWVPFGEGPEGPEESAIVAAIEGLIDAKIGRSNLLLDNARVDKARCKLLSEVGQLLRRIDEKRGR